MKNKYYTCNCRNPTFYIKEVGKHLGLYCYKCKKWITWIKANNTIKLLEEKK